MSQNITWTSVLKKAIYLSLIILAIFLSIKTAVFFLPFVIAFFISLLIEPVIKKIMKNFNISRKISSIIVFIIVFSIILGLLIWGIVTTVSEATNLLTNFNDYFDNISKGIQNLLELFNSEKINIPVQMKQIFQNTMSTLLQRASSLIQDFLGNIIKFFTSIPTIAIYFGITVLALYFICTDKIYMIDELEHHLPEKWVKEISIHLKEITKTLGGYLKAQLTLILISFIIVLVRTTLDEICRFKCRFSFINSIRNWIC